jgi:hypothetical protein
MPSRFAIAAALGASLAAFAQSAQDELESQLKEMVGKPPTKLLVEYEGLDQPNYKLVEVSFELDGSSLPLPELETLNGEGKHLIFHGDIKPGKHTLETTVVLTDVSGALFSYEAGFKWKVKNTRSFEQQPGLEIQVAITPELNAGEKDPKRKFVLKSTAVPKMLAKLEDGTMPEVPKPDLTAGRGEPDAGAVAQLSPAEKAKVLKAQQAEEARLKKQQAMEDAKRKKEEAAAARAAALEERKRQREEALAAKKAAAEEKKRQREEALAAKKAAAEEDKRQREEALAARAAPAQKAPKQNEPVAVAPEASPAPAPADTPDAGAAAVAAAEPPKAAPAPLVPPPASSGTLGVPLPVIIGIGVAVLGLVIFVATRKKSPPQF